ncbi:MULTISPECIES: hypothetical protein [unclassified Streptomyces]|uniref:hypothetical protein n=1 Tax=unclassified Streptomyces TaxID=2593676 RepID=UPI001EF39B1F|nr:MULTISPECIES: hypothetical protein [unclassified Streptomyces]MCZ4101293.1 hypothetical protein [Streptomyces sp. H39-C1]
MSNDFDAVLRKLALEAAEEVTDANGRINLAEFHAALDGRIRQVPELYDGAMYKATQSVARDFAERRSPRRHRKTGGLYHPKSIFRLGRGIWVWMKDATPTDTTQWASVSSRNTVRVIAAEAEKQQYALDRTSPSARTPPASVSPSSKRTSSTTSRAPSTTSPSMSRSPHGLLEAP